MKSSLHTPRESLALPIILSTVGHGVMLGGFTILTILMTYCGDSKPIINTENSMQVAMIELPKSATNLPDRATRAPKPVGTVTPTPQPAPPPDVKHTSDLVVKTKKAQAKEGVDTKRLEDALKQFERDQALADMQAALGTIDRSATDPNSTSTTAAASGAIGAPTDPEFARYVAKIRALFLEQFHPLKAIKEGSPGLKCVVHVQVEPSSGRILRYDITRPSGVDAFDAAARRAVDAITTVPLPPEKYLHRVAQGYDIEFK